MDCGGWWVWNLQGRPGAQAQGRLILQPECKSSLEAEFPLSWEEFSHFFKAFHWLEELTHIIEGKLRYSKSTDLSVNLN